MSPLNVTNFHGGKNYFEFNPCATTFFFQNPGILGQNKEKGCNYKLHKLSGIGSSTLRHRRFFYPIITGAYYPYYIAQRVVKIDFGNFGEILWAFEFPFFSVFKITVYWKKFIRIFDQNRKILKLFFAIRCIIALCPLTPNISFCNDIVTPIKHLLILQWHYSPPIIW